tara:strand:- start:60209 stop:60835 length:627 start_codon:yes stop_codon:yes gene_type:complete
MSCDPAHLSRIKGSLSGRDAIWYAIRCLKHFSLADLEVFASDNVKLLDISREKARAYVQGLEAAGFVERISSEPRTQGQTPHRWTLLNDVGVDAPRVRKNGEEVKQGRGREQMWRTMRILNDFDAIDLKITASTDDIAISENTAKDYIYNLHKAGYLILTTQANNGGGLSRYRLLSSMYTGPKPPMVQRIKQVFDANLNKVVWPKQED